MILIVAIRNGNSLAFNLTRGHNVADCAERPVKHLEKNCCRGEVVKH